MLPQQLQTHLIRSIGLRRSSLGLALPLFLICYLAAGLLGCSGDIQNKIKTTFFDDVTLPPPKRMVREDLVREIAQLKLELAEAKRFLREKESGKGEEEAIPPAEKITSWPEVVKLFPKRADGSLDWTAGLKAKIIAPRAGIDPRDAQQASLDLDMDLTTSSNARYAAFFPHDAHTQWLSCANCHPSIYPLKQQGESEVVTMAKINAGESCGVCHGTVAFSLNACVRCHPAAKEVK